MQVNAGKVAGSLCLLYTNTAVLKTTTKLTTKLQKRTSPNTAGAASAACHETSIQSAGFWYVNESLKSGTHCEQQYLQHAVPPIAR